MSSVEASPRVELTPAQRLALAELVSGARRGVKLQTLGGYAGCLSGDTVVQYIRGDRLNSRPITLEDLFLKFNGKNGSGRGASQRWDTSIKTYIYSLWPDGSVAKNEVLAVFQSGIKPVLKIEFDNGNSIVLTSDHPVATPEGDFVEAGSLAVGDFVLGIGDMKTKKAGRRPLSQRPARVVVNVKYHPLGGVKEVECNGIIYRYKRVARARLVVEAAMNDVSYDRFVYCLKNDAAESARFKFLPKEMDVHHVDEDSLNDEIGNLEVVPHNKHPLKHNPGDRFNREYTVETKVLRISNAPAAMTYDIQMVAPANNFAANRIFVHNTGKTTVLKELYRALPGWIFCAFTGKAACVMQRKGIAASTIHSAIYKPRRVGGRVEFILKERHELGGCGFAIDEGSMVSTPLWDEVRSFGLPVIVVGDHGQLEPVGDDPGLMREPMYRLEEVHRNAGPIARFAEHLRLGRPAEEWASGDGVWVVDVGAVTDERLLRADQVICAFNKTRVGINRRVRALLGREDGFAAGPTEGDRVICLRNDREAGVFNGQQGVADRVDRIQQRMLFRPVYGFETTVNYNPRSWHAEKFPGPDEPRVMLGRDIPFDFSYCITAHKSQGDEFGKVIVFEQRCDLWDHRRWAYTAGSRAKSMLLWVVSGRGVKRWSKP